ncbi:RNB domain-containing ribonuclease [Leifsonia sp. A12D58]|uniref:RNB domain-containing ribonuclease n=1 Tax=Leifsonia sp. A12D58 TaxID=3397674 RepID=UPI0039E007D4
MPKVVSPSDLPDDRETTTITSAPAATELSEALAQLTSRFSLVNDFSPAALAEAVLAKVDAVLPERDLTDIRFFTIDPEGSTDLDQAMHIAREPDGFTVLYAIADVSNFVEPHGPMDVESHRRGQTIYAPDGRIPLYPTQISEGAASLLPNVVRGAFVWELTLDHTGNVTSARVERARITSSAQLSYASAQEAIDNGSAPEALALLETVGQARIVLERIRGGASLGRLSVDVEPKDGSYILVRRSPLPVEDWNAQISLMTGMAAAGMMLSAGTGILRTMPPPDAATLGAFRAQAAALGHPWPADQAYGEYLRSLDVHRPNELAIMHAARSLFRGATYTAFEGEPPAETIQAAIAAPYAHVTAPIRRLVDRYTLVICEAISADVPLPQWVRSALPGLPAEMRSSDQVAGSLDRAAVDIVEAAVLSGLIGHEFDATVISANTSSGQIQIAEPAVTARCTGAMAPGEHIRARLIEATIATGVVRFEKTAGSQGLPAV